MEGMERYEPHPARDVAVKSMTAVESGDREGWLALFSDDGEVADPIGPSPFDPDGKGHRGKQAIAAFYDNVMAAGKISFTVRESYACGDECANVATITTRFEDGSRAEVDVVSTYRIDEAGNLAALRAYWEYRKARMTPAAPNA